VCPNCGKKIPSLDKLAKDTDSRNKVMVYIDKAIETSKNQVDEAPESATAANIVSAILFFTTYTHIFV
jgi:protein MPE1